jgi:hypothetical protein
MSLYPAVRKARRSPARTGVELAPDVSALALPTVTPPSNVLQGELKARTPPPVTAKATPVPVIAAAKLSEAVVSE